MTTEGPAVFALGATHGYGERVAQALGVPLAAHEDRTFEDGERRLRPLESVRGRDTYVLHSLYRDEIASVHDKLCQLLFFVGALRDASAGRVTVVAPYLCYSRKDRRTKPRDPIGTRYVAQLFEALGVDRVVTIDVHNVAAFQNAFRCPTEHLEAASLFVDHVMDVLGGRSPVVVSPDAGGVKRADRFRTLLQSRLDADVPTAFLEKYRSEGVVSGSAVVGDVSGRLALVVDDLIASGTTIARAGRACRTQGAVGVIAYATHGVFSETVGDHMDPGVFDAVVVTDSVPFDVPHRRVPDFVSVIDSTDLMARAIHRMHTDGSVAELSEADGSGAG